MDKGDSDPAPPYTSTSINAPSVALTHRDYNVGWICALSKEQTAAVAMLDHVHENLDKPSHDQNTYTLGSIGKHNVVIACLPKGRYATIPAAQVAIWMMGTFPSVKIGLMVGIGGGIPSKVRLGHVVVSTPSGEYPGVVQWDMGKTMEGGHFERTGSLNSPPTVMLTALAKLETQHEMYGSKIPQYLDELAIRFPRLKATYTWSDSLKDPLDRPENPEIIRSWRRLILPALRWLATVLLYLLGWFTLTSPSDPSNPVAGKGIDTDNYPSDIRCRADEPIIHYGLIASGNQVVKDADLRDRLNESLGGHVLCVEMEAAGLMHNFPCIVIRGICDYADAQKNKDWQGYAAAVAAGYAKELLQVIDPLEVEHAPEARIVTQMLHDIVTRTESIVNRQQQQMEQEDRLRLFSWLSILQTTARHHETKQQRVEGTGTWLLKNHKFTDWSSATPKHSVLCCYGDPGAGKTFLLSLVIEVLEKIAVEGQRIVVGYMYCDYRDQEGQTVTAVLGAILQQFLARLPAVPDPVWRLYRDRIQRSSAASLADVEALIPMVCAEFDRIYICFDALDEFSNTRELIKLLRKRFFDVQIYLTCRPHIRGIIKQLLGEVQDISIEAQDEDLCRFIEHEIGGPYDLEPDAMDEILQAELSQKIVESAKGVFLLPVLHVRAVLGNLTISERRSSLQTLPSTLGGAFAESFQRIQQQSSALSSRAAHIIAWTLLYTSTLTMDKLLCSLAVREGDSEFDYLRVPVRKNLLNCCQGLVVEDQETSEIRLVHYTLQEYLQEQGDLFNIPKKMWHDRIAAISLTILQFPISRELYEWKPTLSVDALDPISKNEHKAQHMLGRLVEDAHRQWGHYLRQSQESQTSTLELAIEYLVSYSQKTDKNWRFQYILYTFLSRVISVPFRKPKFDPLHVAAYFGLQKVTSRLVSMGFDIDARDSSDATPLFHASLKGHEPAVQLLIEKGAALDVVDTLGRTPLFWASEGGSEAVIRFLIEKGAAVDQTDNRGQTSLFEASQSGHDEVVQLLIDEGAAVNQASHDGSTPLFWAIRDGHEKTVLLLIENGATVDPVDKNGRTPLSSASIPAFNVQREVHAKLAQLLIGKGAVVDRVDEDGRTPLSRASQGNNKTLVRLLIEKGAAVDSVDKKLRTPLLWATTPRRQSKEDKDTETIQLLINKGAVIDSTDENGRTPLSWASENGHKEAVQLLIEHGAEVDAVDKDGRTPLSWASENGHKEAVQLLVEHGAEVDAVDKDGRTPLSWASCGDGKPDDARLKVVQLLIEKGAVVNSVDKNGSTPLLWACVTGSDVNRRFFLLQHGAWVDEAGWTPVFRATKSDNIDLIQLLIEKGAAVNVVDEDGDTPLYVTLRDGKGQAAQLLIEHGAAEDKSSGRSEEADYILRQIMIRRMAGKKWNDDDD